MHYKKTPLQGRSLLIYDQTFLVYHNVCFMHLMDSRQRVAVIPLGYIHLHDRGYFGILL